MSREIKFRVFAKGVKKMHPELLGGADDAERTNLDR